MSHHCVTWGSVGCCIISESCHYNIRGSESQCDIVGSQWSIVGTGAGEGTSLSAPIVAIGDQETSAVHLITTVFVYLVLCDVDGYLETWMFVCATSETMIHVSRYRHLIDIAVGSCILYKVSMLRVEMLMKIWWHWVSTIFFV